MPRDPSPPPPDADGPPTTARVISPLQMLKGVGPRRAEAFAARGITTPAGLLRYYPYRYVDATTIVTIADLRRRWNEADTGQVTVVGKITKVHSIPGRARRVTHTMDDGTGAIQLVWFGAVNYFEQAFAIGETLAVFGTPEMYNGVLQFVHPNFDRLDDEAPTLNTGIIVPHYSSGEALRSAGLDSRGIRRAMRTCVERFAAAQPETLPATLRARRRLAPIAEALRDIHFPFTMEALEHARRRLKYEEFFLFQVMLAVRRRGVVQQPGIAFTVQSTLARRFVDSLPFVLTTAQKRAVREIGADMARPEPMNRLLQGDVGSGKTIVAVLAMLVAVDNGYQAALMVPTEVLCEQHFRNLSALLRDLPLRVVQLVGGQHKKLRRELLADIAEGRAHVVVGTHALIQEHVAFQKLGLVVIDEQHRFGVMQRATLRQKSHQPDVLVMTATPIPRTLAMTAYGDLEVSVIDELPAGRQPIVTRLGFESDLANVWTFVRKQLAAGRQAYVVFPIIEKGDPEDTSANVRMRSYKAAVEEYERLRAGIFKDKRVGLLHGRLFGYEKDEVMKAFVAGELDVLVATTVIEVGVDVPNASVMVIVHAERFGLAQLHQLRGRVGRGAHQSYCLLVASDRVQAWRHERTEEQRDEQHRSWRRLQTMTETTDGFRIAEVDLELRGPGDLFGTRQSGVPMFTIASLVRDGAILAEARDDARVLIASDPHLRAPEHRALREYLRTHYGEQQLAEVG